MKSDAVRRSVRTFIQVFVGVFAITLIGFLGDVSKWAASSSAVFPSLNPLAKGLVAALCAAAATLVTLAQNWAEDKTGKSFLIPKSNPDPEPTSASDAASPLAPSGEWHPPIDAGTITADTGGGKITLDEIINGPGPLMGPVENPEWDSQVVELPPEQSDQEDEPSSPSFASSAICNSPYHGKRCHLLKGHDGKHERA